MMLRTHTVELRSTPVGSKDKQLRAEEQESHPGIFQQLALSSLSAEVSRKLSGYS